MRYAKIIIDSRWGALGTLVLLQCYGFLLALFFAAAVRHALSKSSGYELPGHLFELAIGLAFLAVFVCAQGNLLTDISKYLQEQRDLSGWVREAARLHGVLRILITAAAVVFYIGLLSGRITLGLPELNIFILLGYQVFHPLASHFVGKRLRQTSHPTETRYISAAYRVFGLVMCVVAAAVFYAFGMWMKSDHEPAYWMLQMIGAGVAVFGLAGFLLEDIKGREREVIVDPEDLANN